MNEIESKIEPCNRCKHYYNLHISYFNDWHNDCNAGWCYLCAAKHEGCGGFEEGDVPKGEIRGEDEYDRKKRKELDLL